MKTFVTADHHFAHPGILRFTRNDGTPLRAFPDYQTMEDELIKRWNSVVGQEDKVYHLGDFAIGKKGIKVAAKLNGRKTLIAGNHDIFNTKLYMEYFDNVRGYRVLETKNNSRVILSHIPIHPSGIYGRDQEFRKISLNIHGHLHANRVTMECGTPDPKYICVSVEQTNYFPVDIGPILDSY
jgi:calcineurin-like phosphoesterase family protein